VGGDAKLTTESAGTGQTRIAAEGIGGDLALSWRPKRTTAPAAAPILKAQGILEVFLGEGDQLQASARLTVQSLNEPFQVFTVELPPGMRLRPGQSDEYEITPSDSPANPPAQSRQKATVRLRQPTIGPVTVRLDAVSGPQAGTPDFVEVGGFEIEEAVEQWGRVLLIAAEGDSVSWVESANIVQSSDPVTDDAQEVAAQFRYFAQPFSLLVKATPQKTRIRVEPTYAIEIFSDHVKLTADLAYQIHGARASVVRVDLEGWELESVGGDEVVNPAVKFDQVAPLEIPFRTSVSGDVAVRLTARRIVEGAKGSLRIPLPEPAADFAVSAVLAVAPSDNLEVTPLPEQMHGLLPEPPAPLNDPVIARKAALFYRTRAGEPQPVFAAAYEVKTGQVTVESEGEIRLANQRASLRQQFTYNFAYEPVDRVAVDVPREAQERGELRLLFDESPMVPIVKEEVAGVSPDRVRLYLTPTMALGRHVLAVEYSLAIPEIAPQETIAYSLPLAAPAAPDSHATPPKMVSNALRIAAAPPLQAGLDGNAWKLHAPRSASVRDEILVSAEGPQEQLSLMLNQQSSDEQLSNAVDRLWLQSWLTAAGRRDHAALELMTHQDQFRVRLPPGADPESLIVFLQGRRLPADGLSVAPPDGDNPSAIVAIELESVSSSPFHLELWYGFTTSRSPGWRTRLAAPEFLDVSWVRQLYWQLVLPPDEHLVTTPAGFHAEQVWRRRGVWWGREPTLDQRELEQWSGASQQPAPPAAANEYLFSSFGAPLALNVPTVHRTAAVLTWSGIVLVMGLLLLRTPPQRQLRWIANAALVGSVIAIAAIALFPDAALLAMQCASIGAAGVALAWFAARMGNRRRPIPGVGAASARGRIAASVSTRTQRRQEPVASTAGLPHDSSP
jgi:hypothetical protein